MDPVCRWPFRSTSQVPAPAIGGPSGRWEPEHLCWDVVQVVGEVGSEAEDPAKDRIDARQRHLVDAPEPPLEPQGRDRADVFALRIARRPQSGRARLDLDVGRLKLKQGGGLAGHNGLRSIDQHLGSDFRRVRLGIGHPGHKERVTGHVLGNFAKVELDPLTDMLAAIGAEAPGLARGEDARFMSDVALRMQPD